MVLKEYPLLLEHFTFLYKHVKSMWQNYLNFLVQQMSQGCCCYTRLLIKASS